MTYVKIEYLDKNWILNIVCSVQSCVLSVYLCTYAFLTNMNVELRIICHKPYWMVKVRTQVDLQQIFSKGLLMLLMYRLLFNVDKVKGL